MLDIFGVHKFSVEWVDSCSSIAETVWKELYPPHVEGLWWYALLERSKLDKQFKFFYAVVKSRNEIVAVAPTFLFDVPIELVVPEEAMPVIEVASAFMPNLKYQRTLFIGSPCAEEGLVGIKDGIRFADVAPLLQDAADKKARQLGACMIVWKDFPESFSKDLMALAHEKKMFCITSFPGTVVTLKDDTMESYLQSLKSSHRHNLKKKLRKSREAADLQSDVIQNPDENTLREIFSLFLQTYERGKTKFEKLDINYFREAGKLSESYFVVVREKGSGAMVAFMLCFKLAGKIVNKFIGLDYSKPASWSLYFRLWEASLEWVLTQNCSQYLSGQTGYRFKIDVGNTLVPLNNYCKHTNPMVHAVFSNFSKDVSWATLDDDLKVYLAAHPDANVPNKQPAHV
ncbi:MAG TPA: hypothetical protein V6C97_34810 [Oculatellaceae cyanobacterium]